MTGKCQREVIVRPSETRPEQIIAPLGAAVGDDEAEADNDDEAVVDDQKEGFNIDTRPVWEKMQDKIEDLNTRVVRHFEDQNDRNNWTPPMVKTPPQPTREEWLKHQLTHTPYEPWCKYCNAARAVRHNHQSAEKRAKFAPDTYDEKDGLVKINMD